MRWLEQHLDLAMAVAIVALLILRDNGVLVLSAETLLYIGVGGAGARGLWERRKRAKQQRVEDMIDQELRGRPGRFSPPPPDSPDDTTPKDGAA